MYYLGTSFAGCLCCVGICLHCCFLMIRRPPRSTRTDTLFPYPTLVRSVVVGHQHRLQNPFGRPCSVVEQVLVRPTRHRVFTIHVVVRSEEHTSELQSLMRISYAVFCLKKKKLT